jgi:hypothetical protein
MSRRDAGAGAKMGRVVRDADIALAFEPAV